MTPINYTLVIPNLNGANFLPSCLESIILSIGKCPRQRFEIILIDNGSSDSSLEIFQKFSQKYQTKQIKFKQYSFTQNQGFAIAANQGIALAQYAYVCLLNTDVTLDPNWFKFISQSISHHHWAAIFCGTVLKADSQTIESQGVHFDMSGRCLNLHQNEIYQSVSSPDRYVWGSSAAAVVYRRSALVNSGKFDETFFNYIEDIDLAYRLHQLGYLTCLNPQVFCHHLGGGTSNSYPLLREYYTFRNWFKLIIKNYRPEEILFYFPAIVLERGRNLSYLLRSFFFVRIRRHDHRH